MRTLLSLRQQWPAVFTNGTYQPLDVSGPDSNAVVAFARVHRGDAVIVVVSRLYGRASDGGRTWPCGDACNASVEVAGFSSLRNALTSEPVADGPLVLRALFETIPVAVIRGKSRQSLGP